MLWRSHFTPTPALTAQGRHVHGRCNPGRPRATWRRTFIDHLPTLDVAQDEAEAAAAGRLCWRRLGAQCAEQRRRTQKTCSYSTQVLCAAAVFLSFCLLCLTSLYFLGLPLVVMLIVKLSMFVICQTLQYPNHRPSD